MLVKCRCGVSRTTQPWKSNMVKNVDSCLVCSPGRMNKSPVTGRQRPLTTVEKTLLKLNKGEGK